MYKIKIEEFLALAQQYPILDVRSPGEYIHGHLPGAYSLPLFSDEERKVVGTAYKQEGREQAIKIGLDFFGVKMRRMVEEAEEINSGFQMTNSKTVLVHCWRGGMRSAGVAWLLDLYGFKVYTLTGGYKSFRNWALAQFEQPHFFKVVGGYTGSGKTKLLKVLAGLGQPTIDLEGLARHKGSAFGALGELPQPTQEMFENELASALFQTAGQSRNIGPIWIEDESRRIGNVNIPGALWDSMQHAPLYFLDIPFEQRLQFIAESYGRYKQEELVNAIMRIQKRLGGQNAKKAISYLNEDQHIEAFRILLEYYDKYYKQNIRDRKNITVLTSDNVDAETNSKMLIDIKQLTDGITNGGN